MMKSDERRVRDKKDNGLGTERNKKRGSKKKGQLKEKEIEKEKAEVKTKMAGYQNRGVLE